MLHLWKAGYRGLLIALILAVQTASLSHAAEYGEEDHEHEGVECQIVVITAEDAAILPDPVRINFEFSYRDLPLTADIGGIFWKWPPERGPPPRSPPSFT